MEANQPKVAPAESFEQGFSEVYLQVVEESSEMQMVAV